MEKQQNEMTIIDKDINIPKSKRQNSMCLGGFEIPKASRIIDFTDEYYVDNFEVIGFMEDFVSDKNYKKLEETALLFTSDSELYFIYEYYPICYYECDPKCMLQPTNYLNSFIKSISLIIVGNGGGKCYSISKGKLEEDLLGFEYICYYTDIHNRNYYICQATICHFLLKKPNLVVSDEGVLIFYNDKHILATLDCDHYASVNIDNINNYKICEITTSCDKNVIKVFDFDIGTTTEYCIKFDIDPLDHKLISYHFE